jgi:hypothetical protein
LTCLTPPYCCACHQESRVGIPLTCLTPP